MDTPRERPATLRERQRQIVLLRGLLIIAAGALLVEAGVTTGGFAALVLLAVFALSDLALPFVNVAASSSRRLELVVGAADLVLVGLGILLAGAGRGALPVSCLLMVLVVALGNRKLQTVAGAAAVGALHAWLVLRVGSGPDAGRQLLLQMLFLCSVGLYYGVLAGSVHRERREQDAKELERGDLTALLEILGTVTSSLDLQKVAQAIVTRLNSIVPSARCSIVYINNSKTHCTVIASHDVPDFAALELDLARYPEIREAIETRDAVLVDDVLSDPLLEKVRDHIADLNMKSLMVVPLLFGDDLLGTLCLRTARSSEAFTEREIRLCNAAARASANALKNALLHREVVAESARRRATGQKLTRILNHSPDLIVTTDAEGLVTEFNRGAERLLGYRRDDVLGWPCSRLLVDRKDATLVQDVLSSVVLPDYSCRLRRKDGAELEFELHLAALKDEHDRVVGTVWLGRDVTELKAAQRRLLQADKLSSIGEVISGVAHELNNPLSAVVGFAQLMMARQGQGNVTRHLERINDSALRCQKIVRNLLSFARAHKPERKLLGVNGIIEKTLDLKKYQLKVNNIELVTELDRDLPRTMLDFHQIQQVIINLINNAQQAMQGAPGKLRIRTGVEDGLIRIEVEDNGAGMDEAVLERIFDPFFTTKDAGEGTGLGLSVSYGIVNEHGGRIHASSRKGRGTTFHVDLPIIRQPAETDEVADDRRPAPVETEAGRRVLVVDDEPMIVDLLMEVLEDLGHDVDTAGNGREACRKIEANSYDMVITDVRMPHMNGLDLYRQILLSRPELKNRVIFITGAMMDDETVDYLAELNAKTLPKPLAIDRIVKAIDATLRGEDPAGCP